MKNKFDFSVPLTKEEIQQAQDKKDKTQLNLGELIAKNKGLVSKHFNANPDETPMINGYKMLKETP